MRTFWLKNAETNYNGFQELLDLKNILESAIQVGEKDFFLDMSHLTWFEGNLCACLGALLVYFNSQGLNVYTKLSKKQLIEQCETLIQPVRVNLVD